MRPLKTGCLTALLVSAATCAQARCAEHTAAQVEFFEKRIRPLLVERCHKCHALGARSKGGLRLDERSHLLEGGGRGPAIVVGSPGESLLLRAVRHDPAVELRMPPDGKLSDEQIADLGAWIEMGVPWPSGQAANARDRSADDHETHWAFRPLGDPSVPKVARVDWPRTPIDHFVLSRLEEEGLTPAPKAEPRELLRRVTFDLIGLPPTIEQLEAFLADPSEDALARVVDRLLASPRYGERWARHWLDLVNYADTDGHEFDPDKPNAYRYRDYVIESLNIDLAYDRFVLEHFAGDLIRDPRTSADGQNWASPVATGFFWLGEAQNVPVDPEAELANQVERQIDVMGKAFLALTLACARCHDHKFDPIPVEDYYSLAGYLESSTHAQACVDTPAKAARITELRRRLEDIQRRETLLIERATLRARLSDTATMAAYLLATHELLSAQPPLEREGRPERESRIRRAAEARQLEAARLEKWLDVLVKAKKGTDIDAILSPWVRLARLPSERFGRRIRALGEQLAGAPATSAAPAREDRESFDDFEQTSYAPWTVVGQAFGDGPVRQQARKPHGARGEGFASSLRPSEALRGRLISPPFTVDKKYINYYIAGGNYPNETCVNVLVNGQAIGELQRTGSNHDSLELKTIEVTSLRGRTVRLEIVDQRDGPWGHVHVDEIFFSDAEPSAQLSLPNSRIVALLTGGNCNTPEELAAGLQQVVLDVLAASQATLDEFDAASERAVRDGTVPPPAPNALDAPEDEALRRFALDPEGPLASRADMTECLNETERAALATLAAERKQFEDQIPESSMALVTTDAEPQNARVQIRGDHHQLGPEVPRRFLSVLSDANQPPAIEGSGRLQLGKWFASAANPLTARVMVNRLWQHHFGTGLVGTPSNFGKLGAEPTHPDLLDYLASRFIESGWSLKAMHRMMVRSATYQQSSRSQTSAVAVDPTNRLWHHVPMRRLEAEAIRDSMLAVAGALDERVGGPGVKAYFEPYWQGRDLPPASGPLDGESRRSIYLEVRRNYLPGLLTAFDFPRPTGSTDRRARSVVPTQALVMMNNQFVWQQAERWARRILQAERTAPERVEHLYLQALSRPPRSEERDKALGFVTAQAQRHRRAANETEATFLAWRDLCQTVFLTAEFIWVP